MADTRHIPYRAARTRWFVFLNELEEYIDRAADQLPGVIGDAECFEFVEAMREAADGLLRARPRKAVRHG